MEIPPIRVVLRSRPPMVTVWMELDYEGTDPPLELFADLEMIGWRPPVPAAPPASAIDWSATDLADGQRYRVRPWRVTGAVVDPPSGTGSRGNWAPAERSAFLVPLEGVLRRHGLVAEPPSAPPAPPPVPARGRSGRSAPAPDPSTPRRSPTGATVVVTATISPASKRDAVGEALAPLQVPFHMAVVERMITSSYRGSTFETPTHVLEVQVLVEDRLAELVARVLTDCGLHPTVGPPAPDTTDRDGALDAPDPAADGRPVPPGPAPDLSSLPAPPGPA